MKIDSLSLLLHKMKSKRIVVKKLQGSPYSIEQEIAGRGATATIVKAYNKDNMQEELACKIINITEEQNSGVYKTQLMMLKELPPHPNLVNYKKIQISSQKNLYLIMEYCNGGNLDKWMFDAKYKIGQEKIWFFLQQFCQGYKVLYKNNLIHRDIKPQNILIHNGDFKIADFGLSKAVTDPEADLRMSLKGTPTYMAPQLPQNKEGNAKIDIFALGVVTYRMAFDGKFPFYDQGRKYRSVNQYFKELKLRKLIIPKKDDRSPELVQLIEQMLQKNVQKRISWNEMFEHKKIIKAFRCQKKMTSMQAFKKSLIYVNKSVIEFQDLTQLKQNEQKIKNLNLQQAFNKNNKSNFEKRLYRQKLLYTLIDYTNGKIRTFIEDNPNLHKRILKFLHKSQIQGLQFSLFIIHLLKDVSGEWDEFSTLQINNFQNIFANDAQIIEAELKRIISLDQNKIHKPCINLSTESKQSLSSLFKQSRSKKIKNIYQDTLYGFLTDYHQYPRDLRQKLRPIMALLVDIYDMTLKLQEKYSLQDLNWVDIIENESKQAFYDYLLKVQSLNQKDLCKTMKIKGLIFS